MVIFKVMHLLIILLDSPFQTFVIISLLAFKDLGIHKMWNIANQVFFFFSPHLQQQGSSAANQMEIEKLKLELRRSMQMVQQWKKMYENLHQFSVSEILDGHKTDGANGQII